MSRSLALTGRRPVPSPRAQAVGTQSGKKSLQARFFAAASPAASALAGFPPKRLTREREDMHALSLQSIATTLKLQTVQATCVREDVAEKPAKEGALKSKEKKSDFRSSFFDYAIHSSFLRTCRRRPTPSAARGHAQKKIKIMKKNFKIVLFRKLHSHVNSLNSAVKIGSKIIGHARNIIHHALHP